MKKYISSFLVLVSAVVFSQTILNSSSPDDFRKLRSENKKRAGDSTVVSTKVEPFKYGFIEDKDVIKSITVWEIIDMNDKINQPFYYVEDGLSTSSKSLYQILLDGINSGDIKEVYEDENFDTKLTPAQIKERTRSVRYVQEYYDRINAGEKLSDAEAKQYIDVYETTTDRVKVLKIKGMWYVDRRDGYMKYRLLGIAAMGQDPQTLGQTFADKDELIDLFWVFYPSKEVRELMANHIVYNSKNSASDLSYDDLLNARRFSTVIYRSEIGMGHGVVKDYIPKNAEGQLEESERIKNQVLQMESEMWNY